MLILSENNTVMDTDKVTAAEKVYYGVLDFTRPKSPDYHFNPLVFVDTYQAPAVVLEVGNYTVVLPFKWSILITYADQAEVVPIKELPGKEYDAFCLNPISGYMPRMLPIRLVNIHNNASWTSPPMDRNKMLVVPIGFERDSEGNQRDQPLCMIVGEQKVRAPDTIDMSTLW